MFSCPLSRYLIDQSTDQEQIFNIDAVTGAVTLGKILDRETAGWHNITVTAVEAGMSCTSSEFDTYICLKLLSIWINIGNNMFTDVLCVFVCFCKVDRYGFTPHENDNNEWLT